MRILQAALRFTFVSMCLGSVCPIRAAALDEQAVSLAAQNVLAGRPIGDRFSWSQVRALPRGTPIVVIVTGARSVTGYVVAHDDSELTVLNFAEAAMPAAVETAILDLATQHPERFAAVQQAQAFSFDHDVRLGPDGGVFVAQQKVGDLSQLLEKIERSSVVEISRPARERNLAGCAAAGYGGFVLGGFGGAAAAALPTDSLSAAGVGLLVGGTAGAIWLYRACRHVSAQLIYRAP